MIYTVLDFYKEHLKNCTLDQLCSLLIDKETVMVDKKSALNSTIIELIKTEIRTKVAS